MLGLATMPPAAMLFVGTLLILISQVPAPAKSDEINEASGLSPLEAFNRGVQLTREGDSERAVAFFTFAFEALQPRRAFPRHLGCLALHLCDVLCFKDDGCVLVPLEPPPPVPPSDVRYD